MFTLGRSDAKEEGRKSLKFESRMYNGIQEGSIIQINKEISTKIHQIITFLTLKIQGFTLLCLLHWPTTTIVQLRSFNKEK